MFFIRKAVLLFILLSICSLVHSQSYLPQVVPLTPNVAELNKYGEYNVSALTGRPDISIPLYTVEIGDIKVPISLSYFASGIKVSQLATWVGLGWSLNAGGVISRTVRGLPDNTQSEGWIDDPTTYDDFISPTSYDFLRGYADLFKDPAPDFFSYNMNGQSGRFIYRKSKHAFEAVPYDQKKIEWRNYHSTSQNDFFVMDGQGNQYIFGRVQLYTYTESPIGVPRPLSRYAQAWYLTEIISSNRKDTVRFEYNQSGGSWRLEDGFNVNPEWSVTKKYEHVYSSKNGGTYYDDGIFQQSSFCSTTEPILSQISFRTGKVVFHARTGRRDFPGPRLDSIIVYNFNNAGNANKLCKYNFSYSYFSTQSPYNQYDYRLKLTSLLRESTIPGTDGQKYEFAYNENVKLPSTSSTAQDFWGFYNGRDDGFLPNVPPSNPELFQWFNNSPVGVADRSASDGYVEAGILKRVIYPTGGFTNFVYESNKYKSQFPANEKYYIFPTKSVTAKSKKVAYSESYEFEWTSAMYQNLGTIDYFFSPHTDPGPFSVEDMQQIVVTDLTSGSLFFSKSHTENFSTSLSGSISTYFTPGHRYRVTLTVRDEPSLTTYVGVSIYGTRITQQSLIKLGGGLRIKEIINYDSQSNVVKREKYSYKSNEGDGIGFHLRSDEDFNKPYYYRRQVLVNAGCLAAGGSHCQCLWDRKTSIVYTGEGHVPQITTQGAEIIYSAVVKEEYGKNDEINGKVEYSAPFAPNVHSNSIYNPTVPGGREYIDNIISINVKPSEKIYSFDKNSQSFILLKEKSNRYSFFNNSSEWARNVYRDVFYPDNCTSGGNQASINDFTSMGYQISFGAYRLTKSTEIDYSGSSLNPVVTEDSLYYDNPKHLLATRQVHWTSDGTTVKTISKFPQDFTGNEYGTQALRDAYINDQLIESATSVDGVEVMRKATGFKKEGNCIVPDYAEESVRGSSTEVKVNFLKYDDRGKLLEVARPSGPKTCYVWGYSGTCPIAKIENIEYDVLKSLIGTSDILSWREKLNPGIAELTVFFSRLRSLLPQGAFLTTYTYDPLVGMTSQTDNKGQTTYYDYDGFQRLWRIRDQQGKIVKEYKYHYKQ
ncbi:hypothetical protein [Pararcticibacter amylolyticus]|uniref:Sugar-binding protein n=1 Tax=Pararcticibacter amylolyticus TaxID=2173175 RepID=A0A2U2P9L1_9SPHI|nr:hypothetical protein [Pararcticibacter amylolyticus]PWG78063.1 hypothetical protein DDR33_24130 [Pararcticibacter amylolyticus]